MSAYPRSRLLIDPSAEGATGFDIRPKRGGQRLVAFVTGGVNGKTARDTAIGNLADMSEWSDEPLVLHEGGRLPTYMNGATLVAEAYGGVVRMAEAELQ